MNNKPFIKCFKTRDKYYMYDVNKNTILNISDTQYNILEKCLGDTEENIENYMKSKEISTIYKAGFLASNKVEEIIHPADELLTYRLQNDVKMLILQVTQQCNFRCDYCVYSGGYLNRSHSNKKMSISTALKGIDFIINHSRNNDEINIGFYGGEPLLEFNLIKKCIEYAEKKAEGKKLRFNMTTNGSILTEEIVKFLYENNVLITISLDGPKEIHDANRKFAANNIGSFDKVIENIANIQSKFPKYIDKINFSTVIDTKNDFDHIDKFFVNNEIVKNIRMNSSTITRAYEKVETKIETRDEEFYLNNSYELFRIFYYSIRKKKVPNCSKIAIDDFNELLKFSKKLVAQKTLPRRTHPSGPCIPGAQRLFMDVDGFFYPCEKASEDSENMQIGYIDTGFNINNIRKILNIGKLNEEDCKKCWAIRFCWICACAVDDAGKEFSKEKKEKFCQRVKFSIAETFENYCFLKEFGYRFEDNKKINLFDNEFKTGRVK